MRQDIRTIAAELTRIREILEENLGEPNGERLLALINGVAVPTEELVEQACAMGMEAEDTQRYLEKLRLQGAIYQPKTDHWQVV